MIIDAIDSYYNYVRQQMLTLGAQVTVNGATVAQPFGGIVEARDWPQTPVNEGSLYLLVLSRVPNGGTRSQKGYEYFLQWSWLLIGQNIQASAQGPNRGDRYRTNVAQIEENLRQANYPGFTQKRFVAAVDQQTGAVTYAASTSVLPVSGYEPLMWSELNFKPRSDSEQSGLLYGAASVELYSYSDVSPLVA